ncbi:hypothetical protein SE18_21865 [Herpetosiphon geysericola]|uniref:Uncharacterized protein n=1 Tax=Herpetosiphon geysericola TaxID=70996 RepID=A0A0P6XYH9_9CHLR|nr:hypothetical protein SE18_21865 [Herpetosiphon geysericola]
MLGDENPRRFPPAEGRKGGETNLKHSAINKNETTKGAKHTKGVLTQRRRESEALGFWLSDIGGIDNTETIHKTNIRGCWGMKTPGVSLRRRDGRVANQKYQ